MKLPPDVIKGSIEIAQDTSYFDPSGMLNDGERYFEVVKGYKVGHLTLHQPFDRGSEPAAATDVRHDATGMILATCPDFETAVELARAADRAIDWNTVKRNGDLVGFPLGWTKDKAEAVAKAIEPFAKLPEEGPPSSAHFFPPTGTHRAV